MLLCAILIILSVAADQITKQLVLANIAMYEDVAVLPGIFHFTYIENKGAAFGMLANNRWVFLVISTVAIAAFVFYIIKYRPKDVLLRISLSFVVGGGIGNMIDRCFRGSVVDFIEVDFIDFYVFNVADMFVCVGCGLMVLYIILSEIKDSKAKKAEKELANADKSE
ncbi:MAG: signal peptidase II [Clostridia bacterium]|nr:signal peptidase II [Clostridia bacterium]MBR6650833.1 signal peptidase II [Clostridia bacterium]